MEKIELTVTKNEKVGNTFHKIFMATIKFRVNLRNFPTELQDRWMMRGFRIYLAEALKGYNSAEEVHQWINRHNGQVDEEAWNDLPEKAGKTLSGQLVSKLAKMNPEQRKIEAEKLKDQLEALMEG